MNTNVGLWIDDREAVVVLVSNQGVRTKTIASQAENQPERLDRVQSTASHEARPAAADVPREREFTRHLHRFLDRVIECVGDAKSVLILGPGEAKSELRNRLEKYWPHAHRLAVETADKMTDPQIAAKVREYFLK